MVRGSIAAIGFVAFATATVAQEATTAAQDQHSQGLSEVVVTAQRREESAQRAAVEIQAISSAELTNGGVTRPEDLNNVVTGVQIGTGGPQPQVYVRGIGTYATNNYAEGAVAMNIDGVYISRPWAIRDRFFDLDRVEVLIGPQGTLYGRNASGGAINLITTRPVLAKFGGYVEAEGGNFSLEHGTAALNLPVGDDLAFRVAGDAIHRNGYEDDGYMDDKSQAARLSMLYQPSQNLSVFLVGDYQHTGEQGIGWSPEPPIPGTSPWIGLSSPQFNAILAKFDSFALPPGAHSMMMGRDGSLEIKLSSVYGELNWNFGPATLTIVPSYQSGTDRTRFYVPSYQINYDEYDHQASVEARLSNQTDRLKWVVGSYYFDENQGNPPGSYVAWEDAGFFPGEAQTVKSETLSAAGFGQATYSVLPTFRLTAGLRYTYEHKTQNGLDRSYPPTGITSAVVCGFIGGQYGGPLLYNHCGFLRPFAGDLTSNSVTYKAGFEYDLAPNSMLWANFSTGFKSGGFTFANSPTFKPEKLRAWELGVKNRFFDNRVQANVQAFYWKYLDQQVGHLGPADNGAFFTFITENAGAAKSYGISIDTAYELTRNDRVTLAAQWNATKYLDFKFTFPSKFAGVPPLTDCAVGPLTNGAQVVDCSGRPLVRAPEWTGNFGYDHFFDLSGGGTVDAGVHVQFASMAWLGIEYLPAERQDSYALLDADLGYTAPHGTWSVSLWGRNLTDAVVFNDGFPSPFVPGAVGGSIRPPRTYGVRARLNF